jgi:hypothetical protein
MVYGEIVARRCRDFLLTPPKGCLPPSKSSFDARTRGASRGLVPREHQRTRIFRMCPRCAMELFGPPIQIDGKGIPGSPCAGSSGGRKMKPAHPSGQETAPIASLAPRMEEIAATPKQPQPGLAACLRLQDSGRAMPCPRLTQRCGRQSHQIAELISHADIVISFSRVSHVDPGISSFFSTSCLPYDYPTCSLWFMAHFSTFAPRTHRNQNPITRFAATHVVPFRRRPAPRRNNRKSGRHSAPLAYPTGPVTYEAPWARSKGSPRRPKPITLPDLPYAYEALQPYLSTEALEFHHDKHHAPPTIFQLVKASPWKNRRGKLRQKCATVQ